MKIIVKDPPFILKGKNIPQDVINDLKKRKYNIILENDEMINVDELDWYKDWENRRTAGESIKIYRKMKKWTQEELGEKLGNKTKQFVSDIENNRRSISKNIASKLAKIFGTSIEMFIQV